LRTKEGILDVLSATLAFAAGSLLGSSGQVLSRTRILPDAVQYCAHFVLERHPRREPASDESRANALGLSAIPSHCGRKNGFHETLPAAEVQDLVMDFLGGNDVARRDVTFDVPSFLSLDSANKSQQQAH
jgi:hypothetical protein